MGLAVLAVLLILLGAVVRGIGPSVGFRGKANIVGYLVMALGVGLAAMSSVVLISVGEVGVKHFLGTVDPVPLTQGIHFVNPLARIEKLSVREQAFPMDGSVERIEAQTSEQLNVNLEISVLFRIDGNNAPDLFQRIGTEEQIKNRIVLNAVRNGIRDAVATQSINEIFSPNRREIAARMQQEVQVKAGDRIEVLEVFVRDVQAPDRVREAIEVRLEREQQVSSEQFQTQIIQERARQAIEEAKGIAEAQEIIAAGLTPAYLTFHYIERLTELPEGSVVYVPTEGGMPLIRSVNPR
jgi:regulator of protease activity HflC (stomatin/prohibitin superfamily)